MKPILLLLVGAAAVFGVVASTSPRIGHADGGNGPIYPSTIPSRYSDWRLASVAHEEGSINGIHAILANTVGIKARTKASVSLHLF